MLAFKDFGRRTHKRPYERSDSDAANRPKKADSQNLKLKKELAKGKWLTIWDAIAITQGTSADRRLREVREELEANGIAIETKVVVKDGVRFHKWRATDTQAVRAYINNGSK